MLQLGLDEAGRGPWAGPLFVSVVLLSSDIPGLTDSKKLTAIKRDSILEEIKKKADYIGIGAASSKYIDTNGLTQATIFAAEQAISDFDASSDFEVIIDGKVNYLPKVKKTRMVVKADQKYACVSAASVVAKVLRDRYMTKASVNYPHYGFDKNFGYGTKDHQLSLQKHGICPEHRLSFKPIAQAVNQAHG